MGNNDWYSYTIMHKDTKVVTIYSDGACEIHNLDFMPYNLYLITDKDDIRSRMNNLDNFYHWCASRVLTLDRKYAKEILNSIGMKQAVSDRDRAEIAITYHGLSMTDVYWITSDDNISFSDINLYEHSLSNTFVDVSLCGKQLTVNNCELIGKEDVAGDIGTMGVAPKAWVRKDNNFYLYKDGDIRDVNAELLASKIIDCFDIDHVQYFEGEYDNNKVSICKIMTSLDYSIVPIEHIEIYCANHDITIFDLINKYDSYSYHMMNVIDYLVGNTDRHWGNWGFLIDNKTNKPVKLYPLMDFNKAFNSYDTVEGVKCQTTDKTMSQMEAAITAVKSVGLNKICDVSKDWFENEEQFDMFGKRLNILKNL